jgi:dTDP-4-dehydrorhamnose 3,5-epimerase-like enzyme
MSNYPQPYLIEFPKIGEPAMGYISVAEGLKLIPFEIKRVFWTFQTPENILRGRHAHHTTAQVLVAVSGKITVNTETRDGVHCAFVLDTPYKGVYIPPDIWHTMQYSPGAVQVVFASTVYNEEDYIRSYDEFKR